MHDHKDHSLYDRFILGLPVGSSSCKAAGEAFWFFGEFYAKEAKSSDVTLMLTLSSARLRGTAVC